MAMTTDVKSAEPPPEPNAIAAALLLMFYEFVDIAVALFKISVVFPTI